MKFRLLEIDKRNNKIVFENLLSYFQRQKCRFSKAKTEN